MPARQNQRKSYAGSYVLFYRLAQRDHTAGGEISGDLPDAARPEDFELVDFCGCSQSEMQPQVVLRKIAAAAAHFIDLGSAAGREAHARTNGATVRFHTLQLQTHPIAGGFPGIF